MKRVSRARNITRGRNELHSTSHETNVPAVNLERRRRLFIGGMLKKGDKGSKCSCARLRPRDVNKTHYLVSLGFQRATKIAEASKYRRWMKTTRGRKVSFRGSTGSSKKNLSLDF